MRDKWFWGSLFIIWLIGVGFYVTGYDRGLPILESIDERRNLYEVLILRGQVRADLWKPGYPPGILYLNHAAQVVTEWVTGQPALQVACESVRQARLFNVLFNLITPIFLALSANLILSMNQATSSQRSSSFGAAHFSAMLAVSAWLFSVAVLEQTQYVFPQTFEVLGYVLALYFALKTLQTERPLWAVLSVLAGLLAVIFKYTAFPVLVLGIGVSIWFWRKQPRRWTVPLLIQSVLIIGCAGWLFFGYGAFDLVAAGHTEATNLISGEGIRNAMNPAIILHQFQVLAKMIGLPLVVIVLIIGAGLWFFWQRAFAQGRVTIIALVGLVLIHVVIQSAIIEPTWDSRRQILTAIPYTHILLAIALMTIFTWLSRRSRWVAICGVGGFVALWMIPQLVASSQMVLERRLPVSYARWVEYAGTTLPNGGDEWLLVSDYRPFLGDWTCYDGAHHPALIDANPMSKSLEQWREESFSFIQVNEEYLEEMQSSPAGQSFLDEMTLIAEFPPPEQENQWRTWRRGQDKYISVYHTYPIENSQDVLFGESIQLTGYRMGSINRGETIRLWLYWELERPIDRNYDTFVHLMRLDEASEQISQGDGPPSGNPNRPTSSWGAAGEYLYVGSYRVPLATDLASGEYQLMIGLYDTETGVRLMTDTGIDFVTIPVEIP